MNKFIIVLFGEIGVVAMIAPTLGLQARFDPYAGDFGRLELIKIHQ